MYALTQSIKETVTSQPGTVPRPQKPLRSSSIRQEPLRFPRVHILAPEDDCADLLKEKVKIAAEGSLWSITASVAVASNLPLVHPDVIVGHPLLTQLTVCRARTVPFIGDHLMVQTPRCSILRSCIWESSMPFIGDHLMGPDTKVFHTEILHLREQHALHRGPPNGSRHQGVPYWDPASERAACPS